MIMMMKIDMVGVMMAMEMINNMMVREIMKILTIIEKHCGVGGGALNGSTPLPRGFNVEGKGRERDDERERY